MTDNAKPAAVATDSVPTAAEYLYNLVKYMLESDERDLADMIREGQVPPPESAALMQRMRHGLLQFQNAVVAAKSAPFASLVDLAATQIDEGNVEAAGLTLKAMRALLHHVKEPEITAGTA